jgi:hypothetical protein
MKRPPASALFCIGKDMKDKSESLIREAIRIPDEPYLKG